MSDNKDNQGQVDQQFKALQEENEALNVKLAEQSSLIEDQHVQIAALENENLKLKAEIAKSGADTKKVVEVKAPQVITVGGKKYKFVFGSCHVPGIGKMTAAEISQDKEAQKAILAIKGQTILKEIK